MAFNIINNSEFQGKKLYIGYTPIKVLAVNPTKQELEKYFGPQQNDPVYITKDNNDVPQVRIEFIVQAKRPGSTNTFNTRLSFLLTKVLAKKKDGSKAQVIDSYGRTAWATKDEIAAGKVPVLSNGAEANISKNYRPLFIGEDRLIKFIRALFCLNDTRKWDPNQNMYVARTGDDLDHCEGILDNTKDFFTGDYTELKNVVKTAENNTVYAMFGVKTGADGRQFNTIYTNCFVRKNRHADSVSKDFDKALTEYTPADTEFDSCIMREYTVKPTDFGAIAAEMPAAPAPSVDDDLPETDSDDDLPFGNEGW